MFNSNNRKVFEESDRTLDMGFKKDLEEIIGLVSQRSVIMKSKFLYKGL